MTRAEILEARRQLQATRFAFITKCQERMDNAMNDYDTEYYAHLRALQEECGKTGHTREPNMQIRCTTCDKYLRSGE